MDYLSLTELWRAAEFRKPARHQCDSVFSSQHEAVVFCRCGEYFRGSQLFEEVNRFSAHRYLGGSIPPATIEGGVDRALGFDETSGPFHHQCDSVFSSQHEAVVFCKCGEHFKGRWLSDQVNQFSSHRYLDSLFFSTGSRSV